MGDMDFDVEIRSRPGGDEASVRSPAGEAHEPIRLPFDKLALSVRLKDLEIALLRSGGGRRRLPSSEEQTVQDFGRELFDTIFTGEVRSRFDASRTQAAKAGVGLRVKLRIESPKLASLPWEFLYDSRSGDYLVLSETTPLVRYVDLPEPMEPLAVRGRLRILGMVASPSDLPPLDVQREKLRLDEATKALQADGLVEVHWLETGTWRALQRALRNGPWHIFHFAGHGGFDRNTDEGIIALEADDGSTFHLPARQLGRLLGDHAPLRLAMLNACEGARGSDHDLFSSTATTLVRRGTPAVMAMQFEITDAAAIELTRAFYEALADGLPVDAALGAARKAVSTALTDSLEWGTPVLYLRSQDGVLFKFPRRRAPAAEPTDPPPTAAAVVAEIANVLQVPAVQPPTPSLASGTDDDAREPSGPPSLQDDATALPLPRRSRTRRIAIAAIGAAALLTAGTLAVFSFNGTQGPIPPPSPNATESVAPTAAPSSGQPSDDPTPAPTAPPSAQPTPAPTEAPTPTPMPEPVVLDYTTIVDDTTILQADVPWTWDVDTRMFDLSGYGEVPHLRAAEDLALYESGYSVSGFQLFALPTSVPFELHPIDAIYAITPDPAGGCVESDSQDIDDGYSYGVVIHYVDCGGIGAEAYFWSTYLGSDGLDVIVAYLQVAPGDPYLDAGLIERIYAGFNYAH